MSSPIRGDRHNLVTLAVNEAVNAAQYNGQPARYELQDNQRGWMRRDDEPVKYMLIERTSHGVWSRSNTTIVLEPELAEKIAAGWRKNHHGRPQGTMTLKGICEKFLGEKMTKPIMLATAAAKARQQEVDKRGASRNVVDAIDKVLATTQALYGGGPTNERCAHPIPAELIAQLRAIADKNQEFIAATEGK